MSNHGDYFVIRAASAASDALFLGEESADAYEFVQVPADAADGGGVQVLLAYLLSKCSAPRWDETKRRMVRNRITSFRVQTPGGEPYEWEFRREADGSLTDVTAGVGPVVVAEPDRREITVTGPERASTPDRPGTPLVIVAKGHQSAPQPVKAAAPRASAAEAPTAPRRAVKAATGARVKRVDDTTAGMLTIGADNAKGEPVYVQTLPKRHHIHPGKAVRDVFGAPGYWFTIPGSFPASLAEEFHLTRQTFAVFPSTEFVTGARIWVVRQFWGDYGHLEDMATSTLSRRDAVRQAIATHSRNVLHRARMIMEHGEARESRPLPAAFRVAAGDGGWVVHAVCACRSVDGGESFASLREVAEEWLNQDPYTPWAFCDHSPRSFRTGGSDLRCTIGGFTRLKPTGTAMITGFMEDGKPVAVALSTVKTERL